jgi:lysylphosphatidylglycerol synthetase-like protein (DUF2156 family)
LLFRHGEHFYNFQGLRAFKDKFDPIWEPRYLASLGGLATQSRSGTWPRSSAAACRAW